MPDNRDLSDDDYVAKLLAEDARKSSIKYAAAGLSALLPARSTRPGPKPNTRFLSHLVRDVDSHNAALRKKEQIETKTRIEGFRKSEREDERRRALNLAGGRQNRDKDNHPREPRHHRDRLSPETERSKDGKDKHKRAQRGRDDDTEHRHKRRRRNSDSGSEKRLDRRKHDRNGSQDAGRRVYDRERDRGGSRRETSPKCDTKVAKESNNDSRDQEYYRSRTRKRSLSASDSDPLEDVVGPLGKRSAPPAVRVRGRGANQPFKSNIDSHFSSTYDPALDVQPDPTYDPERSDWDMALEALRDRTMWKKKQSDRMREAGFTDEEIGKWEKGALNTPDADKDVRDVKWKQKGERRDWDMGKKALSEDDHDDEDDDTQERMNQIPRDRPDRSDRSKEVSSKNRDKPKRSLEDGWKGKNSGFLRSFRSALGSS